MSAFICHVYPLLKAAIIMIRNKHDLLMKRGDVLIDETDPGEEISALFLLAHSVEDGRPLASGQPHVVSERLQFTAIDRRGRATDAGIAPHLNLRPARPEEIARVEDLLQANSLGSHLEKTAVTF